MGSEALVYRKKLEDNLKECTIHLKRLNSAYTQLSKKYNFPIKHKEYEQIVNSTTDLAYCDQVIYRFSKLQDTMGAKLFKSLLFYEGENVDKPFLDILNRLEKMNIINVDEWFEIRDLRNEIFHEYDNNEESVIEMLNMIYELKESLANTLDKIQKLL